MENTKAGLQLLQENKPTLTQLVLVHMPIGTTEQEAQRVALKEISNFEMLAQLKPSLLSCTPISILLAVKQCIGDNLTLSPSDGLVYLVPSKVEVGTDSSNKKIYEWVLTYDPTANGRLSKAYQAGSILDNKRPVVIFDETGKVKEVIVEFLVPSYPNPRWEVLTFGSVHFKKWMDASAKKNQGSPNANYLSWNGGIDPEFAGTKAIRHGLNKRGTNASAVRKSPINSPIKYESIEAVNKDAIDELEITEHEVIETQYNITTHEVITVNPNDL